MRPRRRRSPPTGSAAVPIRQQRLNDAWTLVMGGQFHDIIPGTSMPKAYEYAWNDQILALNQFAGVLTSATEAVASGMNTQAKGMPVVVYNPLNIAARRRGGSGRRVPGRHAESVRVTGPDGKDVPAQLDRRQGAVPGEACRPSATRCSTCRPADAPAAVRRLKAHRRSSLENAALPRQARCERRHRQHLRQDC